MKLGNTVDLQREYFYSGETKTKDFRITNLKKLRDIINMFEDNILMALSKDLGKSNFEAYATEITMAYEEIDLAIENLDQWMEPIQEKTSITSMPAKSYTLYEPMGVTLIISPWNYPFLLAIDPIIGAMAAGNTIILKSSRKSKYTSELLKDILNANFESKYLFVVDNDQVSHEELLSYNYDHIFYTGGYKVGKKIMEAASKNLSKLTLELGGKSPAIVDKEANIGLAARSIAWGNTVNAGQTCVSPDYILVHASVKERFIRELENTLIEFYGSNPLTNHDYPKIIDESHLEKLSSLLDGQNIRFGGDADSDLCKLEPTIVDDVDFSNKLMDEEIFGPIFPIITYNNLNEVLYKVKTLAKPLALYLFTENQRIVDKVMYNMEFGNGMVNDTLMMVSNPYLEFGGVGRSGQGGYHGYYGFQNFSNRKSIMHSSSSFEIKAKYPPYDDKRLRILRKLN
ncbi:aldehyde dehydrogenase family protein [uncultured Anaerococcus sp.]|uniref:aldehyde dehydrogenase family protein n=1 Tax=uncultured Anaerococcus sp. TaxID=293428 RepID=UPI00261DF881|nr:aldehyde dehydrogenase family protein [uncultured Anaerococcus sp.]